jgi:DNA-binding transcriptional ArsR family regulator
MVTHNQMVVRRKDSEEVLNQLFRALADGTRRDILARSLTETPSVSALASRYQMSFAAVQKHVAVLERAGLVKKCAHGREQLVSVNRARLRRAAGGGIKGGTIVGSTDEYGYKAEDNRKSVNDLHATILHQMGLNHEKLTYPHNGRNFRLTDVSGSLIKEIIA